MAQFAPPPAIIHVEHDMPTVIRSQIPDEVERLSKELRASVAHSTTLAQRGQEQARRISTMEERTRETLRELIVSVGRSDGDKN